MAAIKVKTTHAGAKAPIEVDYDFGGNLDGAVKKFGAEAVYGLYEAQGVISLQNFVRAHMQQEAAERKPDAEIVKLAAAWTPASKRPSVKKPPEERFLDNFSKLPEAEKQKILAQLTAKATAKKAA